MLLQVAQDRSRVHPRDVGCSALRTCSVLPQEDRALERGAAPSLPAANLACREGANGSDLAVALLAWCWCAARTFHVLRHLLRKARRIGTRVELLHVFRGLGLLRSPFCSLGMSGLLRCHSNPLVRVRRRPVHNSSPERCERALHQLWRLSSPVSEARDQGFRARRNACFLGRWMN